MRVNKKVLLLSVIPIIGGPIGSYFGTRRLLKFNEVVKVSSLSFLISSLSTIVAGLQFFKDYLIEVLGALVLANIIAVIMARFKDNIRVNVNEYYIEISTNIDLSGGSLSNLEEVFNTVIHEAMKRIRSPYYKQKLLESSKCSNLRVYLSEEKIILRKRCGDTIIEVSIRGFESQLKLSIMY
jgi:hypothetical protein